MSLSSRLAGAALAAAALALSAEEASAQRVVMRVGYRLTFIGDRDTVDARVVDDAGRIVRTASLTYRIADPAIASVTTRGEVIARKAGSTRLWAVSGKDSSSTLILVEPWVSRFAFSPSTVRLDALGAKQSLRVLASDSAGVPVGGALSIVSTCRSRNPAIATLTTTGEVVAVSNGSTWIRCADRGIADSVPVEVRQRATTASIQSKAVYRSKQFGDTFTIRITARDRQGREIVNPRPTWVSLNPAAVSIDPLTGRARAANQGDAKVIAQIGDAADSTTISVIGGPLFQQSAAVTPAADTTARRQLELSVDGMLLFEGSEPSSIQVTARDSAGKDIPASRLAFSIADTSLVSLNDSARTLRPLMPGRTFLHVQYGTLRDSAEIVIVGQGALASSDSSRGLANAQFEEPPTYPESAQVNATRRQAALDSIRRDARARRLRQNYRFSGEAIGAMANHLSLPEAGLPEDRTGLLTGVTASALLYQRLELTGTIRTGTLSSSASLGEDLELVEADLGLGFFPVSWIGLRGGVVQRREKTLLAAQSWRIFKATAVTRFGFAGDIFNTYAAFSLLPAASYSGAEDSPRTLNVGGEAGIEFRRGSFQGGLTYYVEQFKFAETPRVEEFSALRFRIGVVRGFGVR